MIASLSLALFTCCFILLSDSTEPSAHLPQKSDAVADRTDGAPAPSSDEPAARARLEEAFGKLPLRFEANVGQTDAGVKFLARGRGYNLFLTPTEAVLALRKATPKNTSGADLHTAARTAAVLRMRLRGANASPAVEGSEPLAGKTNYFIGNDRSRWRANVENFARVRYSGVYPGVDMVYYGNQGQLEYDFLVAPGADPRAISLGFEGADKIELEGGDLVLHVAGGKVRQPSRR